jgi:hypothetical protein
MDNELLAQVEALIASPAPKLIAPINPKSPYWIHYQKYDPVVHPTQQKIAVCNLCQKEISVKQGTGGLKSHLKFKHRQQYAELEEMVMMENNEREGQDKEEEGNTGNNPSLPNAGATAAVAAASAALVSRRGRRRVTFTSVSNRIRTGATTAAATTTIHNTTSRGDEQRKHEKHLMDMWSYTRREIDALRQQLKKKKNNSDNDDDDDDGDEESTKDIEQDLRMLRKRKAEYAAMLGLSE